MILTLILRDRMGFGGHLPTGRAGQSLPQKVIHEPSHRYAPFPGFVVETGDQESVDPGRIVAILGHFSRWVGVKMSR